MSTNILGPDGHEEDFDLGLYELTIVPNWWLWEDWVPVDLEKYRGFQFWALWCPGHAGRTSWYQICGKFGKAEEGTLWYVLWEVDVA